VRERPWTLALGGLAALAGALGIGRFVYTPILPLMVRDLHLSTAMAGFIASANFAGYLAGALLAATPLVRGSRRRWLLGALAVSAISTGAMAAASSPAAFSMLRFVGGGASAFVLVFASALVLDGLSAAGRPQLSAVHFAGVGTGIAASAALVSILAGGGQDWRVLWLASGIASVLALAIVFVLIPQGNEAVAGKSRPPEQSGRGLLALVAAYGLFGFGYVITATFLVAIVREVAALRAIEPVIWLIVGLAAAPSVALWTWIAGRLGLARAFAIACLAEAIGVAASVAWGNIPGALLAAILLGGTFMGITALGLVLARRFSRGEPRRILALMTAAFGLGQIVGPTFAGFAHDATASFLLPSLVAAGALLLSAILVLRIPARGAT
jgi:predicted MFS family arabinose efflux permease